MKRFSFVLIACLLLAGAVPALSEKATPRYRLPLEKTSGISSSFGEFRTTRIHTGIDFKTFQKVGLPVRAIADGEIYRIKIIRLGFGKVLYIKHSDGIISVYGHLDRFGPVPELQDLLKKTFREKGHFPGNIFPEPAIAVKQGQLIAYSGETGYGFPHLHFEMRRGEGYPVNPFLFFDYPDNEAPKLRRLFVKSLDTHTLLFGNPYRRIPVKKTGPGRLKGQKILEVSGRFEILADLFDRIRGGNKCGVYRLSMKIDGNPFLSWKMDEMSYFRNTKKGGLLFDLGRGRSGATLYRLAIAPGNDLFCTDDQVKRSECKPAVLDADRMTTGKHDFSIQAADFKGQTLDINFQLNVARKQERPVPKELPRIKVGVKTKLELDRFTLETAPESAYADAVLRCLTIKPESELIKRRSPVYQVRPLGLAFDKPVSVSIQTDGSEKLTERLGIFRYDEIRKRWSYIRSQFDPKTKSVSAQASYLTCFALLYDDSPPTITGSFPKTGAKLPPDTEKEERIYVTVKEIGKGVDEARSRFLVDDIKVETEFDPDRKRLYAFLPENMKGGTHQARVVVSDFGGNRSREFTFRFRLD